MSLLATVVPGAVLLGHRPSPLFTLLLFVLLLGAATAVARSIGALWELTSELFVLLLAGVRALLLIGLALTCVIVIALAGGGGGDDPTRNGPVPVPPATSAPAG
jgi:hypothetical protein